MSLLSVFALLLCRHRRRGGGKKTAASGIQLRPRSLHLLRSLLPPLWVTPPPRRALHARRVKRATKGRKGEGAPPFLLRLLCGRGHPMPLLALLNGRRRRRTPEQQRRSRARGTQDALAFGRLAAVLSSFHAHFSPDARLPHAYAALEGPEGEGKRKTQGADASTPLRAVGLLSFVRPSSIVFNSFFFAAAKSNVPPAYHQDAHLALREETGEQLREGEAHGGRCSVREKEEKNKERTRERGGSKKTRKREKWEQRSSRKKLHFFFRFLSPLSDPSLDFSLSLHTP